MSLLLDALRKSENQRRKGELPPLDQPLAGSPVIATQPRSLRLRTLLVALLLLVIVAVAVGWLIDRLSTHSATPLVDDTNSTESPIVSAGPETGVASDISSQSRLEPEPMDDALEQTSPSVQTPEVAASSAVDINVPTAADTREILRSVPVTELEASDAATDPEPAIERTTPPVETQTVQQEPEPEPASAAATESDPPIAEAASAATQQDPPPEPVRGFIYAWELPLDARQDFPDLDVTVHVFAPNVDNRFVLINGERYAEGDRLAPGVVLREITREGALVDFRNYRILLQ